MLDLHPTRFCSRVLGFDLTTTNLDDVSSDDLDEVTAEVGVALTAVNARIKAAGGTARATGHHLVSTEWSALQIRRGFLAALHQPLLAKRGQRRRDEQLASQQEQAKTQRLPDLSHYFQQVVRNEAQPVDYQRWVLQAEMRRAADATRHQRGQR
jgi:hypothetical protein